MVPGDNRCHPESFVRQLCNRTRNTYHVIPIANTEIILFVDQRYVEDNVVSPLDPQKPITLCIFNYLPPYHMPLIWTCCAIPAPFRVYIVHRHARIAMHCDWSVASATVGGGGGRGGQVPPDWENVTAASPRRIAGD